MPQKIDQHAHDKKQQASKAEQTKQNAKPETKQEAKQESDKLPLVKLEEAAPTCKSQSTLASQK